jgi:hypothetical protein
MANSRNNNNRMSPVGSWANEASGQRTTQLIELRG